MDRSLDTTYVGTKQYLTVGRLMEKLQFQDVNDRVCVCVQNPPDCPPELVTLVVSQPDGNSHDLFVWQPSGEQV